tara:strand:+ start:84258 stop:85439 length:1182 start_codon:yes stop_codon:yes gene_type:complete
LVSEQLKVWIEERKRAGYTNEQLKHWLVNMRYLTAGEFDEYIHGKKSNYSNLTIFIVLGVVLLLAIMMFLITTARVGSLEGKITERLDSFGARIASDKSELNDKIETSVDDLSDFSSAKFAKIERSLSNVTFELRKTNGKVSIIANEVDIAASKLDEVETGLEGITEDIFDVRKEIEGFERGIDNAIDSVVKIDVLNITTDGSYEKISTASGAIVDPKGYVLTNRHVLNTLTYDNNGMHDFRINITFFGGTWKNASVFGADIDLDIAVLLIDGSGSYDEIKFGNSNALQEGTEVVALGHPVGLDFTATKGIVSSGDHRELDYNGDGEKEEYIQTDTALNPGNSGGPLINKDGRLVGINTLKFADNFEGLGFAIPSNAAKESFRAIKDPPPASS